MEHDIQIGLHGAPVVAPELTRALDIGGFHWTIVGTAAEAAERRPDRGWSAMVVDATANPDAAWSFVREFRGSRQAPASTGVLVVLRDLRASDLERYDELYDDFCVAPTLTVELEARIRHLVVRSRAELGTELVEYRDLLLDIATHEASIAGRSLDLTYTEYELLKFLSLNPGKVFTRETLLNRVWGYEYYGGARTVDVHVRRLRAKLGEEYASLIETVRLIGYRFGQKGRTSAHTSHA